MRVRWLALAASITLLPVAACSSSPSTTASSTSTSTSSSTSTSTSAAADTSAGSSTAGMSGTAGSDTAGLSDTAGSSSDDTGTSAGDAGSSAAGSVDPGDTDNGDSSPAPDSGTAAAGSFAPCSLLTPAQIAAQVGGTPSAGKVDPNDAQHCIWEVPGSTFQTDVMKAGNQTVEVGVSMGTPIDRDAFDGVSKQVGNTPVSGVGDAAYFNATLFNVDFLIGRNQYDVEMPLIGATSPDTARTALTALAKEAAATL